MKAQKRFKIPRPEYSSVIVKKDEIPHPSDDADSDDSKIDLFESQPTIVKNNNKASKRSKISDKKNKKRQYIQYPMQQQFAYNNGYNTNYMNAGNYMNAQQMGGAMQFQQPAPVSSLTSHVQNLDGAITRPIVTGNDEFEILFK